MKKPFFYASIFSLIFLMSLGQASETNASGSHFKQGQITGIDPDTLTCVVEIPLGGRSYTVGGVISRDAALRKGGRAVALEDFKIGEFVKVGWTKTLTGHKIESLEDIRKPPRVQPEMPFSSPLEGKLLGAPQRHIIQKKETLLDIARLYDLGFNEMQDLYPQLDPWIPPEGMELIIPSQRILPVVQAHGIVINIAEFRLYYFMQGNAPVMTFPVGLGDREWTTPVGVFRIGEKRTNPTWFIPPSLQHKYPFKAVPPGPDNPLGEYWMGLEGTSYGIHGTDIPWSVGRLVTHGCIRMYPEDIPKLFKLVRPGTPVSIIYEPVKIGLVAGRVYVEVHRDIYDRIEDLSAYAFDRLREKGLLESVNPDKFRESLELRDGLPRDVSL